MRFQKKKTLFLLAIVIPLALFLFWPMGSAAFKIIVNPKSLSEKHEYLNTLTSSTDEHKPNIILITVDDLGMADCSLYGEGDISTPNIDKLGREGVVFENAYVTSPVCAPSRAALITGRYQHRFGFEFTMHERYLSNRLEYLGFTNFIDSEPWEAKWSSEVPDSQAINEQGLPLSEITLAEALKKEGYHTGLVGKWHLGWGDERLPSEFGFDEQYGFFNSHSLYAPEGTAGIVDQKIENDWTDPYIWGTQRNGPHAIYRNNIEIEEKEYLTDRITEESIQYIENQKDEPFFLWTSYSAPHTPLQAPKAYVEQYLHIEDPVKRVYRAMIANLDDNLGYLFDYLHENGLDNNTLIFFISDNGGAEYTHTTDNGKYEGGKNTEFEGGLKVPMIIKWKGNIPAGKRFEPMISSMDIFSTSLAAADIALPNRPIDGVDLLPYLFDSLQQSPHQFLFWQRGISKALRSNKWKMLINEYSGETILYDLEDNPYEFPNVSSANPSTVEQLTRVHKNWQTTHAKPLWPSVIYFKAVKDGKEYYFEQ